MSLKFDNCLADSVQKINAGEWKYCDFYLNEKLHLRLSKKIMNGFLLLGDSRICDIKKNWLKIKDRRLDEELTRETHNIQDEKTKHKNLHTTR